MLSNHDVSSPIIGTAIWSFKEKASVGVTEQGVMCQISQQTLSKDDQHQQQGNIQEQIKLMFNKMETTTLYLFSPIMTVVLYHLYLIEINVKAAAIHA